MSTGGGELAAADKTSVFTKPLFGAVMMKGGQSDERLSNTAGTNENNRSEVFGQVNDPLSQLAKSETGPRRWWRRFIRQARCKHKTLDPPVLEDAGLV